MSGHRPRAAGSETTRRPAPDGNPGVGTAPASLDRTDGEAASRLPEPDRVEGSRRLRVCFVIEGSYPFITGGVSAWVHDLIQGLSEIDFVIWSISAESNPVVRYTFPENVVEHRNMTLSRADDARPGARPNILRIVRAVLEMHRRAFRGEHAGLRPLIVAVPEGFYLHDISVREEEHWRLIVGKNQERNPAYPFSDYFWAWKSAHDLMFTVLGARAPEADIYHAVSTGFAGLAALCAKYRKGKPFLLTEHGLYHKEREMEIRKSQFVRGYQRDMWINTYNRLSNVCYREADLITALFEENRRKQLELGADPARCFVIPNGIDVPRFAVERRPREGFHVGLVGRVVPIKDIKTFIGAAKIILDAIPDAEVHCIGPTDEDPGYYEDCQLLVESLSISDRFHFTGRRNVLEYYAFLDVVMLTSIREAQPLVILEAWSAGVPVVATGVGNIPEMLDYNPRYLANTKDAELLAEHVRWIHDNPDEAARDMEKNRRRLNHLYSRDGLLDRFRALYRTALGAAIPREPV